MLNSKSPNMLSTIMILKTRAYEADGAAHIPVCLMNSANLSRCGCQPHALKVLLITGRLFFCDRAGLKEFRPLLIMMFFTHLLSFLHPPVENMGSSMFVCFSAHCISAQVQWFFLGMKSGLSRSHKSGWIPSLAVHVFLTSPVLIILCV